MLELQSAETDCGPACLQMVARYLGQPVSRDEVLRICPPGERGTSLAQLADAADLLGMRGLVARIAFQHLGRVSLPCIAHLGFGHFVVIESVTRRRVRVADPVLGRVVYPTDKFLMLWVGPDGEHGTVLLLEASHELGRSSKGGFADIHFFWRYIRAHAPMLAQVLASIGLGSVLQLPIVFLTRSLVDVGVASHSMRFVYVILASQLAMFVARTANDFLRGWVMVHVTSRTNLAILADFLKRLMRVSTGYMERKPIGDILQRIGDHGRIQSFLTSTLTSVFGSIGNLAVFTVALSMLSIRITLIFMGASAALAGWMYAFSNKRRRLDQQLFKQSAAAQTSLVQLIAGMRDIRLAACEREKRVEWEQLQANQLRLGLMGLGLTQHLQGGTMAINELKNILISCVAAAEVIGGHMTLGTMLAISYMIGNLNGPIDQLVALFQSAQDAKISVKRIAEIHAAEDDARSSEETVPLPPSFDLALDSISFRYAASNADVLRDLSLEVPYGSRLAIVGPSGSGKTTLVKLLTRLYDPTHGTITIGGVPLCDVSATQWRRRCGVVMQDGYLFSDTLSRNIALGFEAPDMERMRHVCSLARLDDLLHRLPDGFQTRIGANGHELSAGQRQRVLIARALYKDPDVFIFDEATSSLDGANERELLRNLDTTLAGKTVITIAHRLNTVIHADRIVVLENGSLSEHGTHAELVSSRSSYYHLIRSQLELGA